MISRPLIDLLNSGEAVAITGSGISAEAGIPTWGDLFNSIADELDSENHDTQRARSTAEKGKLPEAFDILAKQTDRSDIHKRVASLIERISTPGKYHSLLADWPFRFHITTNYDHLVEDASLGRLVSVGNQGSELHKVSGGNRDFVWHLHGGCRLSSDMSSLVVTKSDYDNFYPSSNMVQKFKAIVTSHQCVFLGFGFRDKDFDYILEGVGRLADFDRPSFAFIGYDREDRKNDAAKQHQDSLRADYNVEVIPYFKQDGNHADLQRVLASYKPFIVRHSISLGLASQATPTYDPVASSLSIQSSLDIGTSTTSASLRKTLIGARVIAHIRANPGEHDDGLEPIYRSGDPSQSEVLECVATLRESGTITSSPTLDITPEYSAKTEEAEAQLALTRDRFYNSLRGRVVERDPNLDESARERVIDVGFAFLDELCRKRGLGVAQNLATSNTEEASRRTVSLVQSLPDHFSTCAARDEAFEVVHLVADILTRPTEAEAMFLGLLCQASFGQHLVGASETLAKVDLDLISGTCYVLDASVLVRLLSEGNAVHKFMTNLIESLVTHGAILTTTSLFLSETAEHASWAADQVSRYGEDSQQVIDVLHGRGEYSGNLFFSGFFLSSLPDSNFTEYLRRMLGTDRIDRITNEVIADRLTSLGIQSLSFSEWEGFDQSYFAIQEEIQEEIARRRFDMGTYRRPSQVEAEAEVAIIVDGIRRGNLRHPGAETQEAFFLSRTRVVDQLPKLERRICLLPEGLAQWLWSSQATSPRHAELVFQQLLWELAQGGVEFVDRATLLRRFSGVIEAAETNLKALISNRRESLVEKYGPDPDNAFKDADPLDLPRLTNEMSQEALKKILNSTCKCNLLGSWHRNGQLVYFPGPFQTQLPTEALMGTYHPLTEYQRYQMYALKKAGHDQQSIAATVSVSPSTICRELRRNQGQRGYRPHQAHQQALARRRDKAKATKMTAAVIERIEADLCQQWSPEQIAGRLAATDGFRLSTERIYQHIRADRQAGGMLYRHLRHRQKKRKKRYGKADGRGQIKDRVSMDQRPAIVEEKSRIGDWEIDLVMGGQGTGALVSVVERRSRYTVLGKVASKQAAPVAAATIALLAPHKGHTQTITADNGKEFADHATISQALDATVYFAHPYHAWERGRRREHQRADSPVCAQRDGRGCAVGGTDTPHHRSAQSSAAKGLGISNAT